MMSDEWYAEWKDVLVAGTFLLVVIALLWGSFLLGRSDDYRAINLTMDFFGACV
jgi:hypothetical protein